MFNNNELRKLTDKELVSIYKRIASRNHTDFLDRINLNRILEVLFERIEINDV